MAKLARRSCRPFTLIDAMVLIAATAVGFAWAHYLMIHGDGLDIFTLKDLSGSR